MAEEVGNVVAFLSGGVGTMAFPKNIFAPLHVTWQETADLVLPWRHNPYVHRHRAALVISRIQIIAAVFAVLIPLWIIVDALAFDRSVLIVIAPLRLAVAAIFVGLAWPRVFDDPRPAALVMLVTMVLVPPVFYLITEPFIAQASPVGLSGVVRNLYEYVPYTVVAGLSVFPLTAFEVVVCWLAVFITMVVGQMHQPGVGLAIMAGPIWLLILVGGTAMVSGMSQLQYMMALVRRVTFDATTGALTRRAGSELLEAQFRQCFQNDLPLTLAFIDIDRFKQVNDGFGHDVGDQVLRHVAQQLHHGLRQGDALVRWGGEEFLVVLASTDREGARLVIGRLGKQGLGVRPDGQAVTVSVGLAERRADGLRDVRELIELADRRMYEAKIAGRNRAVFGQGDMLVGIIGGGGGGGGGGSGSGEDPARPWPATGGSGPGLNLVEGVDQGQKVLEAPGAAVGETAR